MKRQVPLCNLMVTVKENDDSQIIDFEVPFNTGMKSISKVLWQNKAQFQTNKKRVIGFQTASQDALLDYLLNKGIGKLKNNLSVKPLYKNQKVQGLSKYRLLKCLATGGFSKVYLARSLQNGQFYAAKFVDKLKVPSEEKKVLILNQKKVNQITDYTFLVKMQEFIETENFYVFIMDYCPGGELFYLLRNVRRMTEEQARVYFVQILLGIQYLHKQGIMYRDLKPQNIMIDQTGHAKIADFGLAKFCREKSFSFCGSIEYMSPQIVTNAGHSFQVDYYCLGALLFELIVGCPPFYDPQLSQHETKKNIAYAEVQFPDDFGLSSQVKDLIQKLLTKNPNQRLGHFGGTKEIMLHPWVGKINRAFIQSKQFGVPFTPNLHKFNFDPDEVGMSEERFTSKIQNEYILINERKSQKTKIKRKQSQPKLSIREESTSPYSKKYLYDRKKSTKKNVGHQSLTNLTNVKTSNFSNQNNRGINRTNLDKFPSKKKLSKNKSPSFMSLDKKQNTNKNLKLYPNIPNKLYNMKTQGTQSQNYRSLDSDKLFKKKKLNTQSTQFIKDISNQFMRIPKYLMKKQMIYTTQNFLNSFKSNHLLKKSSKLKAKKFVNENRQKSLEYGKPRQTCMI